MNLRTLGIGSIGLSVLACTPPQAEDKARFPLPAASASALAKAPEGPPPSLSRADFNRRAAELNLPLFWRSDANRNGLLEPEELAVLWMVTQKPRSEWVQTDGTFTPKFREVYTAMAAPSSLAPNLEAREKRRRELVRAELAQGRVTLLESDFIAATPEDKRIVTHILRAAERIERLHARQKGSVELEARIPPDDPESRTLFYRNQAPNCVAPSTEKDPDCSAVPGRPRRISGLYPEDLQADAKFCEVLAKQPNSRELMDHFSVVTHPKEGSGFVGVPYAQVYREDMEVIAKELEAAAGAVTEAKESAFKAYLLAAAKAFRTNDWESADGPWADMNAQNSAWYLRIAPDEAYEEPCAWKAAFALTFARVNPESLTWQKRLEPVKGEMEKALAALAGPPYKARAVKFHLPDFINIVLNAGDSRPAHGAVAGQSLPNWGRIAERGGRTMVMTNLYTDADSVETLKEQMSSLFCPETMRKVPLEPAAGLMSVVLHEAAHNLGPSHEYRVKGKVDDEIFGGPLAATFEELKAQTAALYFVDWLAERKLVTPEAAEGLFLRDVAWAFGHISRGMYGADGAPRTYSHLASIQLGELGRAGVLGWDAKQTAANGKDAGCFSVKLEQRKTAVENLAKAVLGAKARGDRASAEKLKADFVDALDDWARLRSVIAERWLRAPKASFVYSLNL